jgi:antitoxin component HigA of HigAB toxin-antitoxin module
MIEVSEKYVLEVSSPAPITSERQHEEYVSVLDKLASKEHPTSDEEKYAEVLLTLIEAYEEEHHSVPDASPVEVLRTLMEANDLRQKDLAGYLALRVLSPKFCMENAASTKPTSRN